MSAPAEQIAHLQERSLHAAVAAAEILDCALNRLQSAWSVLPDGSEKAKLEQEKVRLAFALYDARMAALRLFPDRESSHLDFICGPPANDRV